MSNKFSFLKRHVIRNWKWNASVAFISIAAYDTWIDELSIIAATFLGLAVLPWLVDIFEKVTLPGGVEIDFKRVNQVLDEQQVASLATDQNEFSFLTDDPNLALVSLRIEIEKRLRKHQVVKQGERYPKNIYSVIDELVADEKINPDVAYAIRDMLPHMNRAAHGEEVPASALKWVRTDGPRLLSAIEGPKQK